MRAYLRPILVLVVVIAVIGTVGLVMLGNQVRDITTSIDDMLITDAQQELIDEVAVMSSCMELRVALGAGQEILLDEESLSHAFARRLVSTAETQLDRMRCGG